MIDIFSTYIAILAHIQYFKDSLVPKLSRDGFMSYVELPALVNNDCHLQSRNLQLVLIAG